MNKNVNMIKYTTLYNYTEQHLAAGTCAPHNQRQRLDTESTASPARHGHHNGCREVMGNEAPRAGAEALTGCGHLHMERDIHAVEYFIDQPVCQSRCCPIMSLTAATLHL